MFLEKNHFVLGVSTKSGEKEFSKFNFGLSMCRVTSTGNLACQVSTLRDIWYLTNQLRHDCVKEDYNDGTMVIAKLENDLNNSFENSFRNWYISEIGYEKHLRK